MVTVIRRPSAGEEFGTALGEGLQMLAQNKLSQMHAQQQQQQRLSSLQGLGLDEQTAQAYSGLPDNVLGPLLKQQLRAQQLSQVEGLGGANTNAPGFLERLSQGINTQQANSLSPEAITKATVIDPALGNALRAQVAQQETERSNREKEISRAAQLKQTEKLAATKAAEEYEKEIFPAADLAQKSKRELQNAREIIANGDFSNPTFIELMSRFGVFPESFKTTDTKKLEAAQLALLKQFRSVVGRDVSDRDLNTLLKRIISPNMTKEQNLALLDLFEFGLDEPIVKKNIYNDIVAKYNDEDKVLPRNLRSLVDRQYSTEMEKRFNELKSQVPEYKQVSIGGQKLRVKEHSEMPDPKQYTGRTFVFDGVKKKSNGTDWVPV